MVVAWLAMASIFSCHHAMHVVGNAHTTTKQMD